MTPPPERGSGASIVSLALTVLAACLALKVAADLLLAALPVLLPAAAVTVGAMAVWRWRSGRPRDW